MDSFSTVLIILVVIAVFAKLYMNEVEKKITNNPTKTIQNKNITFKPNFQQNNKEEFTISKNTVLKIIAVGVTIIALIMIRDRYQEYQAEQQIKQMFYGTTNDLVIEKKNKEITEQMNNMQKQTDEMIKQQNEINQKMQKEAIEQQKIMQENLQKMNQNFKGIGQ